MVSPTVWKMTEPGSTNKASGERPPAALPSKKSKLRGVHRPMGGAVHAAQTDRTEVAHRKATRMEGIPRTNDGQLIAHETVPGFCSFVGGDSRFDHSRHELCGVWPLGKARMEASRVA